MVFQIRLPQNPSHIWVSRVDLANCPGGSRGAWCGNTKVDRAHSASKNPRVLTQNDEHLDQVEHLEQDEKVDHLDTLKPINLLKVIKMIIEKGQVKLPVSRRRHSWRHLV